MPAPCASMRSTARWVLPVLVGPRTAVTPFARSARAKRLKIIVIGAFLGHSQASRIEVHAENAVKPVEASGGCDDFVSRLGDSSAGRGDEPAALARRGHA